MPFSPYGNQPFYPVMPGPDVAPGVPGPVVQSPASGYQNSPSAYGDWVLSQVPGLSPGEQSYLRAAYAGGQVPTYEGFVQAGAVDRPVPQPLWPGGPVPPVQVGGGDGGALGRFNAVMGLAMRGASSVQPYVPGDPHPTSGGTWHNPPPPPAPVQGPRAVGPAQGGNIGQQAPPSSDVSGNVPRPINQPPPEDATVYASVMDGFPYGPPVRPAVQHPSLGGFHPEEGLGANIAEAALGVPKMPKLRFDSPVNHLGGFRF